MTNLHERQIILPQLIKVIENLFDERDGTQNIDTNGVIHKTIGQKISDILLETLPEPCELLEKEITEQFKDCSVLIEFYRQFPNYPITIELGRKSYPDIDLIYNLKVRVSLLTNCFTAFYEEISIHKSCSSSGTRFEPARILLISSQSEMIDPGSKRLHILIDIVKKCFKDYLFVSHYLLFKNLVPNRLPHGVTEPVLDENFPIYAFLFDNEFVYRNNVYVML